SVATFYTATLDEPASLTAGTLYAYSLRIQTARVVGTYNVSLSQTPDDYPNGAGVSSTNGGATWPPLIVGNIARDLVFKTFMSTGFDSPGTFISSIKDANPLIGATPHWDSIAWNASVPPGTTLEFHAAASDSTSGPFTFVGPDGTEATS